MKKLTPINSGLADSGSVRAMFDDIAPTYDLLNRIISFGLDRRWRARVMDLLAVHKGGRFLDIACGSGDLALATERLEPSLVVATDFAVRMLETLETKVSGLRSNLPLRIVACDALHLPFRPSTFDAAMVAFGIRNFSDRLLALKEMHSVLTSGGTVAILELTTPQGPIASAFYRVYAHRILPFIGKIISRHRSAYRYLPSSIEHFPPQDEFLDLMQQAGFGKTRAIALSFGAATIFTGEKPG